MRARRRRPCGPSSDQVAEPSAITKTCKTCGCCVRGRAGDDGAGAPSRFSVFSLRVRSAGAVLPLRHLLLALRPPTGGPALPHLLLLSALPVPAARPPAPWRLPAARARRGLYFLAAARSVAVVRAAPVAHARRRRGARREWGCCGARHRLRANGCSII